MAMPAELKHYTGLIDDSQYPGKLKTWHKQAIVLHLEGWRTTEIAQQVHKNPGTVRQLLQSDLAKQLINDYYSFLDAEYRSLYQLAVESMRDAMRPTAPLELRVNTAKFFLQGKVKMNNEEGGNESAEDLVQRVINVYVDQRGNSEAAEETNQRLIPNTQRVDEDE